MNPNTALVITSINAPNPALIQLAAGSRQHGIRMIVIGDSKSPADFHLDGVDYYDLAAQRASDLAYAQICPERHYARKNIGYLLALQGGAEVIIETDDDNLPRDGFWASRQRQQQVASVDSSGWVNVYRYFSDAPVWPRGLPLNAVKQPIPALQAAQMADCPIQQGLADDNPDVDAVYRLTQPLPITFNDNPPLSLARNSWCPFNSQNTSWFRDAFALMYLPAHCSFRMTDIWRSFVSQRLAWEMDWRLLFHSATVYQERNEHNLMRDFEDEIPGYLHNSAIAETLGALDLHRGRQAIDDNLRRAYQSLIEQQWVGPEEAKLVDAWLADLRTLEQL